MFSVMVSMLIVLIFVYAAVSKLIDFDRYQTAMYNQVFPHRITDLLIWLLPASELTFAGLLSFEKTRCWGMIASGILMACFTAYTAAVLLHLFQRVPCTCGGLFSELGWTAHFILNFSCLLLLIMGIGVRCKYSFNKHKKFS